MIRFSLLCANNHSFEGWFRSGAEFESLREGGRVECSLCGVSQVKKALMAPSVATTEAPKPSLSQPQTELEQKISALKAEVEKNSHYVGGAFASEARKMHAGEAPARAIHGEARLEEARALLEEGVPVLPLPFAPTRKSN